MTAQAGCRLAAASHSSPDMTTFTRFAAGCLATVLVCAAGSAALADVTMSSREGPPGLTHYVAPLFPDFPKSRGIAKGTALVAVSWDDQGRAEDVVVLDTSFPAFGEEAREAVSQWRRPAGKRGVQTYSFSFGIGGVLVVAGKMLNDYAAEARAERPPRAVLPEQLDEEPRLLVQPMPVVGADVTDKYQTGRVVVEYFVDEDGRVRAPSVIHATADEFARAALAAMAQWRYEAPRRGGKPVVTSMRYAFDFKARDR